MKQAFIFYCSLSCRRRVSESSPPVPQGVGDVYTDPQIHTVNRTFGDGDTRAGTGAIMEKSISSLSSLHLLNLFEDSL